MNGPLVAEPDEMMIDDIPPPIISSAIDSSFPSGPPKLNKSRPSMSGTHVHKPSSPDSWPPSLNVLDIYPTIRASSDGYAVPHDSDTSRSGSGRYVRTVRLGTRWLTVTF